MTAWIADALIVAGLAVMTLGVYGILRFPDVYTRLHASGKASSLGVSLLLVAGTIGARPSAAARVVLIVALLVFEHQTHIEGLITRANFKSRMVLARNGLDPRAVGVFGRIGAGIQIDGAISSAPWQICAPHRSTSPCPSPRTAPPPSPGSACADRAATPGTRSPRPPGRCRPRATPGRRPA